MTVSRKLFWGLLLLFLSACIWWLFYFPYRPQRLYSVIPPGSVFFSEHHGLAGRREVILQNRVLRDVAEQAGLTEQDLVPFETGEWGARLLDSLARKKTVVAYAPAMGRRGAAAWVVVSWLGARSQVLKFGAFSGLLRGLAMNNERMVDGRRIWQILPATLGTERVTLSMACAEGMLIACFSEDPDAVHHLLWRVDHRAPPDPAFEQAARLPTPEGPDRGWLRLDAMAQRGGRPSVASFVMDLSAADEANVEMYAERETLRKWLPGGWAAMSLPPVPPETNRVRELGSFFGDAFTGVAWARPVSAQGLAEMLPAQVRYRALYETLQQSIPHHPLLLLGLLGDEYSGRVLVRVPGLLFAIQLRAEADERRLVHEALDVLNREYGWSLLARPERLGEDVGMLVIESAAGGLYNKLKPEHRIAVARRGDWLLAGSNADALRRLAGRQQLAQKPYDWAPQDSAAGAWIWLDFAEAKQALSNVLSAYTLVLIMQGGRDRGGATRTVIEQTRALLEMSESIGHGQLWLAEEHDVFRVGTRIQAVSRAE